MKKKKIIGGLAGVVLVMLIAVNYALFSYSDDKKQELASGGTSLQQLFSLKPQKEASFLKYEAGESEIQKGFSFRAYYCEEENESEYDFYLKLLQMPVGKKLTSEKSEERQGYCILMREETTEEDYWEETELTVEVYESYIEITDSRGEESQKCYYEKTKEAEALFGEMLTYAKSSENLQNMLAAKPIIYLYPEQDMDIQVKVEHVDFTTVYPAYNEGWNVQAEKDGLLYLYGKDGKLDKSRKYYGLYYEGNMELQPDWRTGFTVQKEEYQKFLEEKLKILGLSDREAEEFIVYWLPQMEQYEAVDVHFAEQSVLQREAPLKIAPEPDTLIRVFMQWRKAVRGEELPQQKITPAARKGYTAVEWGGSEVKQERSIREK